MSATKIGSNLLKELAVVESKIGNGAVSVAKLKQDVLDLIAAAGGGGNTPCVQMIRSSDSVNGVAVEATWHVYDENGDDIDISASNTNGLQEAMNYAAQNGFDLYVYGSGIAHPQAGTGANYIATLGANPFSMAAGSPVVRVTDVAHGAQTGDWVRFPAQADLNGILAATWRAQRQITRIDADTYDITLTNATATTTGGTGAQRYFVGQDTAIIACTVPIEVPPLQGVRWDIHATIDFQGAPAGSPPCILFDSVMLSDIKFTGQIVKSSASYGPVLQFKPALELPEDINGPIITDSKFEFGPTVVSVGSGTNIDFDISVASISSNRFYFGEVNNAAGGTGIKVSGAGASRLFDENRITALDVHDTTVDAINAGTSTTSADNYRGNVWDVHCDPASGDGVEIWGSRETWNVNVTNNEGTPTIGIHLNTTVDGCIITVQRNDAATAMDDDATDKSNKIISPRSLARVYRNANQTGIVTATFTDVTWTTEQVDTLGEMGATTFTCKYSGTYQVIAKLPWNTVVDQMVMGGRVVKNGASPHPGVDYYMFASGTGNNQGVLLSCLVDCVAGDTLKIQCYHERGSNNDLFATANGENCWASIAKVA